MFKVGRDGMRFYNIEQCVKATQTEPYIIKNEYDYHMFETDLMPRLVVAFAIIVIGSGVMLSSYICERRKLVQKRSLTLGA